MDQHPSISLTEFTEKMLRRYLAWLKTTYYVGKLDRQFQWP